MANYVDTSPISMAKIREAAKSASISIMVVGFFMLFFSIVFIAVSPESEHSAFPYPLGVPGIVLIVVGLLLYLLCRYHDPEEKVQSPPS